MLGGGPFPRAEMNGGAQSEEATGDGAADHERDGDCAPMSGAADTICVPGRSVRAMLGAAGYRNVG